jgi:hypothetical protein
MTPYQNLKFRTIFSIGYVIVCALLTIALMLLNDQFRFAPPEWVGGLMISWMAISVPILWFYQQTKMSCPRCGAIQQGEFNSSSKLTKFHKTPSVCFNCKLDFTKPYHDLPKR